MIDLLVVGGGVNGAGIARDAAGRGLKVLLCEQHDLASHTSSASTKLIHGGLRYLEFMEFSLVRKALAEREVLLSAAPHIMYPMRFVMPHARHLRPAWMIRIGLFLYDHLAKRRTLAGSRGIRLDRHAAGEPLQRGFTHGFEYSDGWVDDARLVVLNALDAYERGADIRVHTRCESLAVDEDGIWTATLRGPDKEAQTIKTRAVVNAAGPWAARFLDSALQRDQTTPRHGLRLVKGSHIVVPKLFDHDFAYIFQAEDRRIIFALPYEETYTLIGTTDIDHEGEPNTATISAEEISYLCEQANRYFKRSISAKDVRWHYSGVRPLLADESRDARAVSRDYSLEIARAPGLLLSVFGGKITTYRSLAEEAVDKLAPLLNCKRGAWTARMPLPGGDLPQGGFEQFVQNLCAQHPRLPPKILRRYARAYGTRTTQLLRGIQHEADLGLEITPGLYALEAEYLVRYEWATSADDVLWRRSKLGLHATAADTERLQHWLTGRQTRVN